VTFAKRQIINCIQNIGFAHAIVANKAVNLGRKD